MSFDWSKLAPLLDQLRLSFLRDWATLKAHTAKQEAKQDPRADTEFWKWGPMNSKKLDAKLQKLGIDPELLAEDLPSDSMDASLQDLHKEMYRDCALWFVFVGSTMRHPTTRSAKARKRKASHYWRCRWVPRIPLVPTGDHK